MSDLTFISLECEKIEPLPSVQAITWFVVFHINYEDNEVIKQTSICALLMPYEIFDSFPWDIQLDEFKDKFIIKDKQFFSTVYEKVSSTLSTLQIELFQQEKIYTPPSVTNIHYDKKKKPRLGDYFPVYFQVEGSEDFFELEIKLNEKNVWSYYRLKSSHSLKDRFGGKGNFIDTTYLSFYDELFDQIVDQLSNESFFRARLLFLNPTRKYKFPLYNGPKKEQII